ncbi:2682_t:CDS:2 [Acaulospora colombiana]|uniref:2682_t:CDS:1 n=1 Tax=Acaulospora colombiana TaxID=27376 RepID=A0ACA9ME81_9GLOM|nr:2682_t:CDS:2 [Acaulospora colombiana]
MSSFTDPVLQTLQSVLGSSWALFASGQWSQPLASLLANAKPPANRPFSPFLYGSEDGQKFWSPEKITEKSTNASAATTTPETMTRMKCPKAARGIPESKALWSTSYEIDSVTGFVPCSPPVTSLPPAFARWEQALANATHAVSLAEDDSPHASAKRLSSRLWREDIANAPVLDTTPLEQDSDLLRRAHHVLAFLVHFYVHSCPSSNSILIPESLAVPLVRVSKLLSIAPVLTFADTVLWNHEIIDPSLPLTRSNIRPLTLFTGSDDEANFYGCCAEIELRGVEALRAIANFYDIISTTSTTTLPPAAAASRTSSVITRPTLAGDKNLIHEEKISSQASSLNYDHTFVIDDTTLDHAAACLKTVAGVIRDLTAILQSVRQICDPHAFYFSVRPWFRGSDAAGPAASSQRCWIYQGVDESQVLELSGPSAGQSSIIHTLDIFLDVDHSNDSTMTHQSLSSSSSAFPPTSGAASSKQFAMVRYSSSRGKRKEDSWDLRKENDEGYDKGNMHKNRQRAADNGMR